MSNDSYVRRKVREVMEAGKLPHRQPDHIWGGPGSGLSCAICDVALERDGVELEIQYLPDAGSAGSYRVHVGCFSQFELERQKFSRGTALPPPHAGSRVDGHGRQSGA
jgi:hypothetical protein